MDFSLSLATQLLCLAGYLSGSWLGAVIVTRWLNEPDPRHAGSGNPGTTNVYRVAGPRAAILTLLFDAAKGAIPVAIGNTMGLSAFEQGLIALSCLIGHMLPVFHGFKGGKGVATALGCGLVMAWQTILVLTVLWLLLTWRLKVSSIASMTVAILGPVVALLLDPHYVMVFLMIMALILIRHWRNIWRLYRGEELAITRTK